MKIPFNFPLPLAGESAGEGGTLRVSPSPQSSPPVRGEEVLGAIFYIMERDRVVNPPVAKLTLGGDNVKN